MASEWLTCTVTVAGASVGSPNLTPIPNIFIGLTDTAGSFSNQQFFAANAGKNEMLAVALAAISNRLNVSAQVDSPVAGKLTECYSLYLMSS
jgi:hypothetical protein